MRKSHRDKMRISCLAGKSNPLKRGPWTVDEDRRLTACMQSHDKISWLSVPETAGISRSARSCRLRRNNYLDPAIKRGNFTDEETDLIAKLHCELGNRWSSIAARLPGRTDNEVKNYCKNHIKKTNNPLTHRKMSTGSISGEKVDEIWKSPDGFTSNDEGLSDVSDILSELSSNAGDLWSDDLNFEPNDDFGLDQDQHRVYPEYPNFDLGPELPWLSQFDVPETRGESMASFLNDGQSNNIMIPFPAVAQDHQHENNVMSKTTSNDDVGQSNTVIPPTHLDVDYSYGTGTTLNDTGDVDEQNNGEICLSLEVIKQHFHMNMDDAVESLKVSRSTLKRICRKYGIKRWPCHKRRKIDDQRRSNCKNLNKVINTVGCASSSNSSVTIKATCGDDILKFPLSVSSGLDDLREEVAKRLDAEIQTFKLKYNDDDGDLVLIACDEDLRGYLASRLSRQVEYNATLDILIFPVTKSRACNEVMDRNGSSEEEIDVNNNLIDPQAEDRELKGSLKQEFMKKRKKGEMTKEARRQLLEWWSRHSKWPYPTGSQKIKLAESTGLDQKQINYWFMNQRKHFWARHTQ